MARQLSPSDPNWWRHAVVYQIYPRSFLDSNGDGIGDLAGIAARLDYVADLGADAIWVSPFFVSPMEDFGYDVADYCDVDPIFGTLADCDALIAAAHERGLRVIIDLVLSHSSNRHPWFRESRASRDNPKADWYVWADPKPDGTPPNNWLSIFGGPAWEWDSRRRQYYLHNFLASQPDLNFHNPQVRQAALDVARFWLDRGVDGFRLDVVNFYFHDAELRDNPPLPQERAVAGLMRTNPYAYQDHVYSKTRPENLAFLENLRSLTDRYPGAAMFGEIGPDRDVMATTAAYTEAGRRLHMAYSFELLSASFTAQAIRRVVEEVSGAIGSGWPCWALANHDVVRAVTRLELEADPDAGAALVAALVTSLGGGSCLYQGEELGLTEADIPPEAMQDPYGIRFWPDQPGRDGCRTPMPWQAGAPQAGFSAGTPWLPIPHEHLLRAVDQQADDPDSGYARVRRFLHWRRNEPAMREGGLRFLDAPEPILAFLREKHGEGILCLFNLSAQAQQLTPEILIGAAPHGLGAPVALRGFEAKASADGGISLPPFGVALFHASA